MRDALGPRQRPGAALFVALLAARLRALAEIAAGAVPDRDLLRVSPEDRELARTFLRPRESSWHDGDENLVRGYLDTWVRAAHDPRQAAARGLLSAADGLVAMRPRPETLWCFLWHLESQLASLIGDD